MNFLHASLILAAIALTQLFFGGGDGMRFIYVLPGCLLLGFSGTLAILSFWKAPTRLDRSCIAATALLALYLFARIALSPSSWLARFDFFAVLSALLAYSLTAFFVSGIGARKVIVYGLLLLGIGQVGIGIYQFAKDAGFNPLLPEGRPEASFRATGLFISGNHLAGFLNVALLLSVSFCFWGGYRARGKMLTGYLALVCLAGLVLTGSRGGYLSATAGFAVFTFLSVWTMRGRMTPGLMPRMFGIIAAIVLVGGGLAWAAERSYAIRSRASTVFVSSDIRFLLWEAAWKQFQLAPVFGTGSRSYVYYGRTFRAPYVQNDPVFAHNDWLQTLAEYGIVGFLLVVGFVFAHLRHGVLRWLGMVRRFSPAITSPAENHALALQIGTMSAIAACLVHAVLDFNLHIPANLLLTAFLFGLLATRRTRSDGEKPGWLDRTLHAIPAGLGVWMLFISIPRLPGELLVETARGKFAAGQIGPGIEDAGQAISWGARNPELYFQIGEVQRILSTAYSKPDLRRSVIEEAHDAYASALAIYPQDVKFVLRDAWALGRLGRFEEAERLLTRAKELDPGSPMVWTYSALHWQFRGKPAEALVEFNTAAKLGSGYINGIAAELREKIESAELEKRIQASRTAAPK